MYFCCSRLCEEDRCCSPKNLTSLGARSGAPLYYLHSSTILRWCNFKFSALKPTFYWFLLSSSCDFTPSRSNDQCSNHNSNMYVLLHFVQLSLEVNEDNFFFEILMVLTWPNVNLFISQQNTFASQNLLSPQSRILTRIVCQVGIRWTLWFSSAVHLAITPPARQPQPHWSVLSQGIKLQVTVCGNPLVVAEFCPVQVGVCSKLVGRSTFLINQYLLLYGNSFLRSSFVVVKNKIFARRCKWNPDQLQNYCWFFPMT